MPLTSLIIDEIDSTTMFQQTKLWKQSFAYVTERYINVILNGTEWQLYFKGNSFDADFRREEVTDM